MLSPDEPLLDVYDRDTNDSPTAYRLHLPPLPFQGRPDAPLVLLGLNPGYKEADEANHATEDFQKTNFRNYRHDATLEYPLFFLDPKLSGDAGQQWWHRRLKPLRQHYHDKVLAQGFLSVQYVPYRSTSYQHSRRQMPSQEYGFNLVRQAVARGALVIGLRSERLWKEAIPTLVDYARFYQLSSPRTPVLNEKQLGTEGWRALCAELDKVKQTVAP